MPQELLFPDAEDHKDEKPQEGRMKYNKQDHSKFLEWFVKRYNKTTNRTYHITGGDCKVLKTALHKVTLQELQRAAIAMLEDRWGSENASIRLVWSNINAWLAKAAKSNKWAVGTTDYSPDRIGADGAVRPLPRPGNTLPDDDNKHDPMLEGPDGVVRWFKLKGFENEQKAAG